MAALSAAGSSSAAGAAASSAARSSRPSRMRLKIETNAPRYSRGRSMPAMNARTEGREQLLVSLEELLPADPLLLLRHAGGRPGGLDPDLIVGRHVPSLARQVAQDAGGSCQARDARVGARAPRRSHRRIAYGGGLPDSLGQRDEGTPLGRAPCRRSGKQVPAVVCHLTRS